MKKELIFSLSVVLVGAMIGAWTQAHDFSMYNDAVPFVSEITENAGVWVFLASVLAVSCTNPISAGVNTLLFFLSMTASYSIIDDERLENIFSSYIEIWLSAAILSLPCAALLWFARGRSIASIFIAALPAAYLLFCGFPFWYEHKPMLLAEIIFAVLLAVILPPSAKRRVAALIVSFLMFIVIFGFSFLAEIGVVPVHLF
ncbi:MAG: hypothetical protein LBL82_05835 [Oscillospiraceae bacterium]|nr:hypothetical protein [Oscillospiraceae bacterium]